MTAEDLRDRPPRRRRQAVDVDVEAEHKRLTGTCGKTIYHSKGEAQRGIRKMQRWKKGAGDRGRLIAYLCPTCRGAWHVGHRES